MTQQEELHVVFGATGESGRAVIRELLRLLICAHCHTGLFAQQG